jgi:hypothetical protein
MKNAFRLSAGKPEGKRPYGRARHRWKYNIKILIESISLRVPSSVGGHSIELLGSIRDWEHFDQLNILCILMGI